MGAIPNVNHRRDNLPARLRTLREEAQQEPLRITSHGRVIGAFLSARDMDHYDRLKRRERQVYMTGEIPDDIIEAIEQAEYLKPAI